MLIIAVVKTLGKCWYNIIALSWLQMSRSKMATTYHYSQVVYNLYTTNYCHYRFSPYFAFLFLLFFSALKLCSSNVLVARLLLRNVQGFWKVFRNLRPQYPIQYFNTILSFNISIVRYHFRTCLLLPHTIHGLCIRIHNSSVIDNQANIVYYTSNTFRSRAYLNFICILYTTLLDSVLIAVIGF